MCKNGSRFQNSILSHYSTIFPFRHISYYVIGNTYETSATKYRVLPFEAWNVSGSSLPKTYAFWMFMCNFRLFYKLLKGLEFMCSMELPWTKCIDSHKQLSTTCKTLMLPPPSSTSSKNALKTIWEKFCHLNIFNKITAIITLEYCIRDTISNSIFFLQFLPWIKRIWIGLWCACIVLCKNIWLLVNEFFWGFQLRSSKFLMELFSIIWQKLHEHFPDKNVQGWLCVFLTG